MTSTRAPAITVTPETRALTLSHVVYLMTELELRLEPSEAILILTNETKL